jgi:glucokinase
VDTYNYSDPKELQNGQNPSLMNILNSILLASMDAKHIANGVLAKDSPMTKTTIQIFHRSWILHFKRLAKYSMKTMAAGINDQSIYDNFTNDYLYANPIIF